MTGLVLPKTTWKVAMMMLPTVLWGQALIDQALIQTQI